MLILCAVYGCGNNNMQFSQSHFRFPKVIKNNDPERRDKILSTERQRFINISQEDLTE